MSISSSSRSSAFAMESDEDNLADDLPFNKKQGHYIKDASTEFGDEIPERGLDKLKSRIIKYSKLILPHIGLVLLLITYTVVGAGVFHWLEYPNEQAMRKEILTDIRGKRSEFVEMFFNLSQNYTLDEDAQREIIFEKLLDLEVKIFEAYTSQLVNADDLVTNVTRVIWSFPASIFFASTVITTIGYGHIAPLTLFGRVFCIIFGLVGIPLLLVTIADIGKFLSDFITFVYQTYRSIKFRIKMQSRKFSAVRKRSRTISADMREEDLVHDELSVCDDDEDNEIRIPVWMVILFLASYTAIGGLLFRFWEGWDYFNAFYFCFITMTTIGFGDFVPSKQIYMIFTMIYIVVGLAITTMCIDLAGTEYIRKIHSVGQKIEQAKDIAGFAAHAGGDALKQMREMSHKVGGVINFRDVAMLRRKGVLPQDFDLGNISTQAGLLELLQRQTAVDENILYRPVHPLVARHIPDHIKIRPEDIQEEDGYIVRNSTYGRGSKKRRSRYSRTRAAAKLRRSYSLPSAEKSDQAMFIAPFILKESNV